MKPFCIATIATILGIIIGLYIPSIVLFICIFSFFILIIMLKAKKKILFIMLFVLCFIFFSNYIIILEKQYSQKIRTYGEQEVKIQAVIISNPEQKAYKLKSNLIKAFIYYAI